MKIENKNSDEFTMCKAATFASQKAR